jgi:hypothetical protein
MNNISEVLAKSLAILTVCLLLILLLISMKMLAADARKRQAGDIGGSIGVCFIPLRALALARIPSGLPGSPAASVSIARSSHAVSCSSERSNQMMRRTISPQKPQWDSFCAM